MRSLQWFFDQRQTFKMLRVFETVILCYSVPILRHSADFIRLWLLPASSQQKVAGVRAHSSIFWYVDSFR